MNELIGYLLTPYQSYTTFQIGVEVIAASLGILSVICAARNSILVFPTGIISTALYVYLLFTFQLFGDMLVNGYYFVMSIYGWIHWSGQDNNQQELPITYTTKIEKIRAIGLFFASIIFVISMYYTHHLWTNNQNPFSPTWINMVDSVTTSIFFVGMWLMAKRKIENWIFWIIGDIAVIPMFLEKQLAVTAIQYFIFITPAVYGWFQWKKEIASK